jgi:hypothetical protein
MSYSKIAYFFMDRFRRKRLKMFSSAFPSSAYHTVLDIGGTPHIWEMLNRSYEVTLLNSDPKEFQAGGRYDGYTCVIGDGRNLQFPDQSFDLAFSNSVIEHVGNWDDMEHFAAEQRRVGKSFYCQTPNKWFPVEPHLGTLFFHWWPRLLRFYFVTRYLTLWGLMNKPDREQVQRSLDNIHLLTRRDLERLFHDATIIEERFLFIPKSYVVIVREAIAYCTQL